MRVSGQVLISKVLIGAAYEKVKDWRFDEVSTYGLMKDAPQKDVLKLIDSLTAEKRSLCHIAEHT